MNKREPKFMRELHKIREAITKEWKKKSAREIAASLHKAAEQFKGKFTPAHR